MDRPEGRVDLAVLDGAPRHARSRKRLMLTSNWK
jgi:hypothetical protein